MRYFPERKRTIGQRAAAAEHTKISSQADAAVKFQRPQIMIKILRHSASKFHPAEFHMCGATESQITPSRHEIVCVLKFFVFKNCAHLRDWVFCRASSFNENIKLAALIQLG
jgi:hypothetical protein